MPDPLTAPPSMLSQLICHIALAFIGFMIIFVYVLAIATLFGISATKPIMNIIIVAVPCGGFLVFWANVAIPRLAKWYLSR